MGTNYFFEKATGLKADIKRHRQNEIELRKCIEDAQKILEKNPEDKRAQAALRVYSNFLNTLLASKAEVVSKIGKKRK